MAIVDLEVGPYDPPGALRAEIDRVKSLPASDERDEALATLGVWLMAAETDDED